MFLPQLQQEKQEGWVCYLHYTKDVPDATVSVHHKTGQVEHLFVTESARGRGIGQKMLDFARKQLPEHEHPVLTVLNTTTRVHPNLPGMTIPAEMKFTKSVEEVCTDKDVYKRQGPRRSGRAVRCAPGGQCRAGKARWGSGACHHRCV